MEIIDFPVTIPRPAPDSDMPVSQGSYGRSGTAICRTCRVHVAWLETRAHKQGLATRLYDETPVKFLRVEGCRFSSGAIDC